MDYKVKVENFEGPMDLLIFFIQRDKLNIYDIPISHIAKEFLDYMKIMDIINIDLGGEFVYMASLLMKIKARMLLPILEENEEYIEDPRTLLVERLLEYQQYKIVSEELQKQYTDHSMYFPKGVEMIYKEEDVSKYDPQYNITLFDISSIFQKMIKRLPDIEPYELQEEPVHLKDQIKFLKEKINLVKKFDFANLIPMLKTKRSIVVTFLAILEMLRNNEIKIEQNSPFGKLILVGIPT